MVPLPIDPVCRMPVEPSRALVVQVDGETVYFCSALCRDEYVRRGGLSGVPSESRSTVRIAYLSMEIALDAAMPTYAGGLGVLAGDMIRSFADLRVPIVGVTLVHRDGYFRQELDAAGVQREAKQTWSPEGRLVEASTRVEVTIEDRRVAVRAWKFNVSGRDGWIVPVLLLDTDLPENDPRDRALSGALYGGDERFRLAQEIVLGVGGVRMLRALGYGAVRKIHMNEGHASLAALELLREETGAALSDRLAAVRNRCIFTTHTPVEAGHDRFDRGLARHLLGSLAPEEVLTMLAGAGEINMTLLALNLSGFVNGVARRHQEVAEQMFPGRQIRHVTNGVHPLTWTSAPFRELFDRHAPEWRDDPAMLRKALLIPSDELWRAHRAAKRSLLDFVRARTGRELSSELLTIGIARRATPYKRADLVLSNVDRLLRLGRGRLQLVFAGKAHPHDEGGKAVIRRVVELAHRLEKDIPIVYLADYDLEVAKQVVSGVDVWLNTPQRPLEASGTSGMKAALNGVPSLSVLDGWWLEGCIEGLTGWAIGRSEVVSPEQAATEDARDLYNKLENLVLPRYEAGPSAWASLMQHAIALNGAYFTTQRVVQEYVTHAYLA